MEQELKLALERPDELERLLAELPRPRAVIEQRNHYFVDPEGKTREARVMVRVREERRRDAAAAPRPVRLTLKQRRRVEAGVFLADERECDVEDALWAAVQAGELDLAQAPVVLLQDLAAELGLRALQRHAVMTNLRHVIELGGYTLEVDRTELPGERVDAEVEVETEDPEGARSLVLEVAARAGVTLYEQTLSKYARLLSAAELTGDDAGHA